MSERRFLQLSGFTTAERIGLTDQVSEAINRAGAWITDFHQYSNISICINFEVPVANLAKLATTMQETGLILSQESLAQLMPANGFTPKQTEIFGTLQITFVHNEPDLYREIPAVPG
ncbi:MULTISPECIES: hypothetical protein [unclassified Leptolyngbya]|uniref:hypothetical protein n=1 Tax=unclassified Leptolyngbya TaxID=2650499 RepID=UPI0016867C70|nr:MULTISPECIES: hypothetical protein [unclassified Leptolyngbya]MBD1912212.1 hypothetical protein [Leptolyngbya sp. FACHB-8]MBD2155103.1 hypothetical protein [Leptolyngbya sp. FACHB-16]